MYGLVIHGGAFMTMRDYTQQDDCLRRVLEEGHRSLSQGQAALDCVTRAVCMMEDSGLFHAGKGTGRNSAGYHELDASVMDGATGKTGAVASVRTIRNPVLGARVVMEKTPHVFLVAEGAENFLKKEGAETIDPETYFVTDNAPPSEKAVHGTVGAVALDQRGSLAAATSTAGTQNKMEGRVGDTPIIGAATFADDAIALSATGVGEYFIRSVAVHDVAARCRYGGQDLDQAMDDVLEQKIRAKGGWGGMIAITKDGRVKLGYACTGMLRGYVLQDGTIRIGAHEPASL